MNYKHMEDFEINKQIADILYPELDKCCLSEISTTAVFLVKPASGGCKAELMHSLDYCNNPSDAWPIIIDNNISLISMEGSYQAVEQEYSYIDINCYGDVIDCDIDECVAQHGHENALRAAMICFLQINP